LKSSRPTAMITRYSIALLSSQGVPITSAKNKVFSNPVLEIQQFMCDSRLWKAIFGVGFADSVALVFEIS